MNTKTLRVRGPMESVPPFGTSKAGLNILLLCCYVCYDRRIKNLALSFEGRCACGINSHAATAIAVSASALKGNNSYSWVCASFILPSFDLVNTLSLGLWMDKRENSRSYQEDQNNLRLEENWLGLNHWEWIELTCLKHCVPSIRDSLTQSRYMPISHYGFIKN